MGSFANSLFKLMLGWLQTLVSAVWSAFTSESGGSLLMWIGRNWILVAGILCAAGLTADLAVYIVRWKPHRVWKSFFSKDRKTDEEQEYREDNDSRPTEDKRIPERKSEYSTPETDYSIKTDNTKEPDLSKWETGQAENEVPGDCPDEEPAEITHAGYVVPADSPYRRPAEKSTSDERTAREQAQGNEAERQEERSIPLNSRRRRRISVGDLFSDPEEELREFDAPQHVIDSRKAYRDPVYPRGWKKNEDNEE